MQFLWLTVATVAAVYTIYFDLFGDQEREFAVRLR
jgi:hypothetical protein